MVPVVSAHFRSLRRQFSVWRLVHSTRSELDSGVNSRVGMHVLRSNRAPNDLVSLQPIKSRRWRAWPTHASCNWADLLQVSSVHDIVCCEPTLAPHSQEVFAGSRGGSNPATSGVLLEMEVGIRKGRGEGPEGTLLICEHWGEYTLSKKTRRLVYGVYPRIPPNTPLPATRWINQPRYPSTPSFM